MRPRSYKITPAKEKERRKRKSEKKESETRKKAMVALLVFIIATLEIVFGRKKKLTSDGRGNVFTNPARYAILYYSILILIVVAIMLFLDIYVN